MIDMYKACKTVTWMFGEGRIIEDELTCSYGETEASAVAHLEERIDDECPWYMFCCFENKYLQVSIAKVQTAGEFFATFYQKYFG